MSKMTQEELEVMELTVKLWEKLISLPDPHLWDHNHFMTDIHHIQQRVMARATRRSHPDIFMRRYYE